ncbi:hypothetical protein EGT74_14725 [Chitinophaga lutea]|uniref:PH domain-containing protein n=1 Tax=Chitinophaga lutea TaxID=2488634 RepID=A0A3N4PNT3_9BACT|nr:hypothetical protein [Chitinophaga lutea]RPE08309.1 hypothetical protein EGT74_14725 [Chitinophaga lutea]
MKTKTRTTTNRGSKTLPGKLLYSPLTLLALPVLLLGLFLRSAWLIVPAALLLSGSFAARLVRARTVVSLNEKGIYYDSPFRRLHFEWHEIRAAGVYYVSKGQVYEEDHTEPSPPEHEGIPRTIYVSLRPAYSPARHRRLVNKTDIHFRWNQEAWEVITAKREKAVTEKA